MRGKKEILIDGDMRPANSLKNVWLLIRGRKCRVFIILAIITVIHLSQSAVTYLFKIISNYFVEAEAYAWTDELIILVALFTFIPFFSQTILSYFKGVTGNSFLIKLENKFSVLAHKKYMAMHLAYHNRFNIGEKISRIEKGYTKLNNALGDLIIALIPQFIFLIINFVIIILMDWQIGILFLIPFFPAACLNYYSRKKFRPFWEKVEELKQERSGIIGQSILNVQTVKQYNQTIIENIKVKILSGEIQDIDISVVKKVEFYFSLTSGILNFFFGLTLILGVDKVIGGRLDFGTVVFVYITGKMMFHYLWMVVYFYIRFLKNMAAVDEVLKLLKEKPDIVNSKNAINPPDMKKGIEFKNVSFKYPDNNDKSKAPNKDIFSHFNINFKAHKKTALVGLSGVGKTTLLNLLCRYYDVRVGGIELDDIDIRRLKVEGYNRLFANVLQEPAIFDTTIRENVCYPCQVVSGDEQVFTNATDKEISDALAEAGFKEALNFRDGLDTKVGESGVQLSGGQRQRLELARAIIALRKGASILILDESTSSIDAETDSIIQENIRKLRQELNITVIAVSHRLATIQDADNIIVLDQGRVYEQGTHNELLEKNDIYSRLVKKQDLKTS